MDIALVPGGCGYLSSLDRASKHLLSSPRASMLGTLAFWLSLEYEADASRTAKYSMSPSTIQACPTNQAESKSVITLRYSVHEECAEYLKYPRDTF